MGSGKGSFQVSSTSSLGERLRLMHKLVGSSILWNVCAMHPEATALISINHVMYQLTLYMLKLCKGSSATWAEFRQQGVRQAKQLTVLHVGVRWSSVWLSRWWGYQGHIIHCTQSQDQPASLRIATFRNVEWWCQQQQTISGLRHHGH